MRITAILGSPRKKGNTAEVLGSFEELVAPSHQVDRINIVDCDIRGCLGCGACQKTTEEPGCVQEDDAVSLLERMMHSDAVIYASPLYFFSFSSQMKALIDRHFCMVKGYGTPVCKSLFEGKRIGLLVTCHGQIENNADLIPKVFDRTAEYCQMNVIGKYVIPFCTTPQKISSEAIEVARQMSADLLKI